MIKKSRDAESLLLLVNRRLASMTIVSLVCLICVERAKNKIDEVRVSFYQLHQERQLPRC